LDSDTLTSVVHTQQCIDLSVEYWFELNTTHNYTVESYQRADWSLVVVGFWFDFVFIFSLFMFCYLLCLMFSCRFLVWEWLWSQVRRIQNTILVGTAHANHIDETTWNHKQADGGKENHQDQRRDGELKRVDRWIRNLSATRKTARQREERQKNKVALLFSQKASKEAFPLRYKEETERTTKEKKQQEQEESGA